MSEGFRLCIKYAIKGRLAYLSHLETVEAMRRIVRRARLPYAVSEGFNPHMKATFGPALPVGASGDGELFDVRLTEFVEPDEALARLRAAAPPKLMPYACTYTDLHDPALDVAYPVSAWRAEFAGDGDLETTRARLEKAFDALLDIGYLETVKQKKRKTVVKRVLFSEKLVVPPAFVTEHASGRVAMTFVTFQNNEGALRPDKFIGAALTGLPEGERPALVKLVRTALMN